MVAVPVIVVVGDRLAFEAPNGIHVYLLLTVTVTGSPTCPLVPVSGLFGNETQTTARPRSSLVSACCCRYCCSDWPPVAGFELTTAHLAPSAARWVWSFQ